MDVEAGRHFFQARIAPFEGNKVLALIHDIGDRMRRSQELLEAKQRAEEADRMKSVFLANMSHEIRTPLNAIVGFSEIMALTEDEKEKEEYLGIIQQNSNLLLQLINDILDMSRIESGKMELSYESIDLEQQLSNLESLFRAQAEEKHLELTFENDYRKKRLLRADSLRLNQILVNIIGNAIKFTELGSVAVRVKVLEEEPRALIVFLSRIRESASNRLP